MNIYIDESGIFANPNSRSKALSCVGALVIPTCSIDKVLSKFADLRNGWLGSTAEIKGSKLNEEQVASVVELLKRYDVIFKVGAIDLALHKPEDIANWRKKQEQEITKNINDKFHPQLISDIKKLRSATERLSDPLFIQAILSTSVVGDIHRESTLYYCQRLPKELGAFHWIIDAKDRKLTRYERLWREIILPFLQSQSLREPHPRLIGGDYKYYGRFMGFKDRAPDHLRSYVQDPNKPFHFSDIGMIMTESMHFTQSHKNLGVQLADILVTSFRRALDRTLGEEVWKDLGSLMILKRIETVRFISLKPRRKDEPQYSRYNVSYAGILKIITSSAKSMLSKEFESQTIE